MQKRRSECPSFLQELTAHAELLALLRWKSRNGTGYYKEVYL